MISLVMAVGEWVWHLLESTVERVEAWFLTRRWELAPAGIPACLVAAALLFIILGQRSKPAVAVAEPYRQALRAALDAKDYGRAELFLRKLNDLKVADDSSRFQLALLAEASGKTEVALEQVWALAPEDRVGYPPAHLWIAVYDLRRLPRWTAEDRGRCLQHLAAAKLDPALLPRASELLGVLHLERAYQQNPNNPALLNNLAWVLANSQPPELGRALELANSAVQLLPENAEIRETRGQILLRQRQWQAAIQDLEWALPKIKSASLPAVHTALADAYAQLGNQERTQHHREQARALQPEKTRNN